MLRFFIWKIIFFQWYFMKLSLRDCALTVLLMSLNIAAFADLSIAPEYKKIEFRPGQKLSGTIEVSNRGSEELEVQAQPEDWTDKNHIVRGVEWLKVKPVKFKLKPGTMRKVKFTAHMPDSETPQYVTQLFFAARTPKQVDMGIGVRIAALLQWIRK
jgi:P pilus assembly chaperone PapD